MDQIPDEKKSRGRCIQISGPGIYRLAPIFRQYYSKFRVAGMQAKQEVNY